MRKVLKGQETKVDELFQNEMAGPRWLQCEIRLNVLLCLERGAHLRNCLTL